MLLIVQNKLNYKQLKTTYICDFISNVSSYKNNLIESKIKNRELQKIWTNNVSSYLIDKTLRNKGDKLWV